MGGNLSRSAPPQRPLTSMDVVAIDPRYCVSLPTTLHISEAQKLMNNDTITVINATTGIQHFLVESRMFSIRGKKIIQEVNKKNICNIKRTIPTPSPSQQPTPPNTNKPITISLFNGLDSTQPICTFSASFTPNATSAFSLIYNQLTDEETYIYIEGKEWKKKFADVCFGSKTGPVIGQIRRRLGEGGGEIHTGVFTTVLDYFLVVAPGVDAAFLVAFCLALDEMYDSQTNHFHR